MRAYEKTIAYALELADKLFGKCEVGEPKFVPDFLPPEAVMATQLGACIPELVAGRDLDEPNLRVNILGSFPELPYELQCHVILHERQHQIDVGHTEQDRPNLMAPNINSVYRECLPPEERHLDTWVDPTVGVEFPVTDDLR